MIRQDFLELVKCQQSKEQFYVATYLEFKTYTKRLSDENKKITIEIFLNENINRHFEIIQNSKKNIDLTPNAEYIAYGVYKKRYSKIELSEIERKISNNKLNNFVKRYNPEILPEIILENWKMYNPKKTPELGIDPIMYSFFG